MRPTPHYSSSLKTALFLLVFWSSSVLQLDGQESLEMPPHVVETLDRLIGEWVVEDLIDEKETNATMTVRWAVENVAITFTWEGVDAASGEFGSDVGVVGWSPAKQVLVENSIGSNGFTATATHSISKDGTLGNSAVDPG